MVVIKRGADEDDSGGVKHLGGTRVYQAPELNKLEMFTKVKLSFKSFSH